MFSVELAKRGHFAMDTPGTSGQMRREVWKETLFFGGAVQQNKVF